MNTNRLLLSTLIAVSFFVSGCRPAQNLTTDTPVPIKEKTATKKPTTTPSMTSTVTITSTRLATGTPTRTATSTEIPIIDDDRYRPPQENYACDFDSIPMMSGKKIREYYLESSFETVLKDDFGTWYSIEFLRIQDDDLPIPEAFEERKRFLDFDLNYLMDSRLKFEVPQGKIIEQEYIQADSPILLAILDLPGGSNMVENGVPMDATRAVYIVIHGAYSYVISTQYSQIGLKELSQNEIIQEIKRNLKDFYATCDFETDPEVGRDFVQPTITPIPDPMNFLPDMKIQEGLFYPEQGANNVDPSTPVYDSKGDWIQIGIFPAYSILPIPAGWTTIWGYSDTTIGFGPDGNLDDTPILIRMSGVGYIGDDRTSEEVIDEWGSSLYESSSAVIFDKGIVDSNKGYMFFSFIMDDGSKQFFMVIFSEDEQGFYHKFLMRIDPEAWDKYYPIAREMVKSWVDLEGRPLGMVLPEDVLSSEEMTPH